MRPSGRAAAPPTPPVEDSDGRAWPCGASDATAIEFVDPSGAGALYLLPFAVDEQPSSAPGRIGCFSLVAAAPASIPVWHAP